MNNNNNNNTYLTYLENLANSKCFGTTERKHNYLCDTLMKTGVHFSYIYIYIYIVSNYTNFYYCILIVSTSELFAIQLVCVCVFVY